ncbi:hypothetical protein Tco_0853098, partial [Tanacetum coccineum]
MGGYKHNQLKGRSYGEIQKLFDKEMKRVNSFVAMNSKAQEISGKKDESSSKKAEITQDSSTKRAGDKLESDKSKKQKTDENKEVEVDNEAKLKEHMVTIKDDDIAIDAIPLATKPPVIVEYKLIREGIMGHYQLIRADGSFKRYSSMIRMLQGIDREDLQTLWKLVKTKHGDTRPEDEHEKVLWGDLKVMFEPDIKSDVWRNLQGDKVTIWKLYDSCGVHFVRFENVHIFMLVEKRYPLTPITIINMLNKKLQTDYWNDMCYQLLKLMRMNIKFRGGLLGLKRLQGFLELLLLSYGGTMTMSLMHQWHDTYKRGLATVEEQIITYRKNEVLFSEEVAVLKREVTCKDYEINVLKSEFEKVKQEKEGIEFKLEKFDKSSKDLDKLLGSQITDKSKKGLGYNVVPPPYPLIYNRPKKLDLSYSGLDEFKEPEFKGYGSENKQVSKDTSSFVESLLNVDKETVFLADKKKEFVKPKNHEKPVKKSV